MIFAFDPTREAIFLVAGNKAGQWSEWYRTAIPLADQRYEQQRWPSVRRLGSPARRRSPKRRAELRWSSASPALAGRLTDPVGVPVDRRSPV
jgi:Uncharacterized protein conserved in bacteria